MKFQNFFKNKKLTISKIQTITFVRTADRKVGEKFGKKIKTDLREGYRFEAFAPMGPLLRKTKEQEVQGPWRSA